MKNIIGVVCLLMVFLMSACNIEHDPNNKNISSEQQTKTVLNENIKDYDGTGLICFDKNGDIQFAIEGITTDDGILDSYYGGFKESSFAVLKGDKIGVINTKGELIIDYKFTPFQSSRALLGGIWFSDGLANFMEKEKYGLIDKNGETVIPFEYDYVGSCEDGLIMAEKDGKWGYIDKNNNTVILFKYNDVEDFIDGYASVSDDEGMKLIDKSGEVLFTETDGFLGARPSDGVIPLRKNGKYGYVNMQGKVVIPFEYESADSFVDGKGVVRKNGKCGCIDINNNTVFPFEYENILVYESGIIRATQSLVDNKLTSSFFDADGTKIGDVEPNSRVEDDGKWIYYGEDGKSFLELKADLAFDFSEGLAFAIRN